MDEQTKSNIPPLPDEVIVVRYLLNDLTEAEQARFEESYCSDADTFEHLRAVEEELIDDFVRGNLTGRDRELFQRHYLSTPERRDRVRFAMCLVEDIGLESSEEEGRRQVVAGYERLPTPIVTETPRTSWLDLLNSLFRPRGLVIVAATLMLATLGSWLYVQDQRLRRELGDIQSKRLALEQRNSELNRMIKEQSAQSEILQEELKSVRNQLDQLSLEADMLRQSRATFASLVLSPARRGGGEDAKLTIARGQRIAQITAILEVKEYKTYCVKLKAYPREGQIWDQQNLTARRTKRGYEVEVRLAVSKLVETEYQLEVSGKSNQGKCVPEAYYHFRVIRP